MSHRFLRSIFCTVALLLALAMPWGGEDSTAFASANNDPGVWTGNSYHNGDLGIDIQFPDTWVHHDEVTTKKALQTGLDILASDNNQKRLYTVATQNVSTLIHISKLPIGSPNNATFVLTLEKNDPDAPASLQEIIAGIKQCYANMAIEIIVTGEEMETIQHHTFARLETAMIFGKITVRQQQYITLLGDSVIAVTLSSTTDENYRELLRLMHSIVFRP